MKLDQTLARTHEKNYLNSLDSKIQNQLRITQRYAKKRTLFIIIIHVCEQRPPFGPSSRLISEISLLPRHHNCKHDDDK